MSRSRKRKNAAAKPPEQTEAESFFRGALKHVKGRQWAGQRFELLPWQAEEVIRPVFRENPRTIRTVYIEIPRKNGKSTLGAGIALELLFVDREPGGEIYSAAGDREQARIIFDMGRAMVESNPKLSAVSRVYKNAIEFPACGAVWRVLSAEAYSKHGLNAHGIIFDELHVQPNRELWDVLTTSTGARVQPLTVAITTAGYDRNSICWEVHEYAARVRDGEIEDPSFLPVIYGATDEDDWTAPETWRKANPSLGDTIQEEYLARECARAQQVPGYQNTFKRLHLNLWTAQESLWLPMERWDECNGAVDLEELEGQPCYGGLDLSSTQDMTSFQLVFPGPPVRVVSNFWLPGHDLRERILRDSVPYDLWEREGHLILTEGNTVDQDAVKHRILQAAERFDLQEVSFDRWNSSKLVAELQEEGIEMVAFGQGFASMSAPAKEFERMVLAGELAHGGHPVLRWNATNACVKQDPAGNLKPDKSKSTGRIDGIVATIMALGRLIVHAEGGGGSIYDEHEPILV